MIQWINGWCSSSNLGKCKILDSGWRFCKTLKPRLALGHVNAVWQFCQIMNLATTTHLPVYSFTVSWYFLISVFWIVGALWGPSPVCGWHQCPRSASGTAGELLVCSGMLQPGLQRVSVAKSKCVCVCVCICCRQRMIILSLTRKCLMKWYWKTDGFIQDM